VSGLAFHTHVVQLMWDNRIYRALDFLLAAGPQITSINFGTGHNSRVGRWPGVATLQVPQGTRGS